MKIKYAYILLPLTGLILAAWLSLNPSLTATAHDSVTFHAHPSAHGPQRTAQVSEKNQVTHLTQTIDRAAPEVGRQVAYTPPPLPDLSALKLPVTETGGYMLFPVDTGESQGRMEIQDDLRDPLTALGACTRWIVGCVEPGSRSLDDCARSVPQCETDEPWNEEAHCCPASCYDQYAALRRTGVESIAAFDAPYFANASCFPGLEDLLSGTSPAPPGRY